MEGLTWAQIANKLGEEDIRVGTDEIRSYWPRLSEGRSPAEYLLYWRGSQRDAELRVCKMRADAAEVEIEALRQQVQDWERQMQSMLVQDQQSEALLAECDRRREEVRHRDIATAAEIEQLRRHISELTARAAVWQKEAIEANRRAQEAHANIQSQHQQIADLQRQLVDEQTHTAKVASETEAYGNIRYFEGKGEVLAQLRTPAASWSGPGKAFKGLDAARPGGSHWTPAISLAPSSGWTSPSGSAQWRSGCGAW